VRSEDDLPCGRSEHFQNIDRNPGQRLRPLSRRVTASDDLGRGVRLSGVDSRPTCDAPAWEARALPAELRPRAESCFAAILESPGRLLSRKRSEANPLVGCSTAVDGRTRCRFLERLQAVYTALLAAPDAEVVTFQYHLAYPFIAILAEAQAWQIEALLDYLNAQIAAAVAGTRAALPAEASRLTLVEAQVEPDDEDPLKVPRFNIGVPPDANQTWTASFECGAGGFAVDGPSHQSEVTQAALPGLFESKFCAGTPWTIKADTGIHPNKTGYAQFAGALTNVTLAHYLVPQLP
jgi:hypothetical protein